MIEIYKVTNKINGKLYIGQTSRTLKKRKSAHISNSFNPNALDYDCAFHKAIRKYEPDNFEWEVIRTCHTVNESNEVERKLIAEYNTCHGVGYNSNEGGGSGIGYRHSAEAKRKISEAGKGRPPITEEVKQNMSKAQLLSRQSGNRKEVEWTTEQRELYSQRAKDKELWKLGSTPEALEKAVSTRRKTGVYEATRKRQSENNVSNRPEVQQKIADSVRKLWEDPEYRANQMNKNEIIVFTFALDRFLDFYIDFIKAN